ncbi:MAG: hypothetical protein HFACDABA_03016 [Anaerolineales bacterium]|nr:hypothetical protein [Anaerolineales bacterium]
MTINHYPLAVGNTWTYQIKGGRSYTSAVTGQDGDAFIVSTTLVNAVSRVKKIGDEYHSDSPETGRTMIGFKENLKVGDTWVNSYKVNGIDTTLTYRVKESGISKDVNGATFKDVILIEADSAMSMNGNAIPMKYVTQYFYAKGVGLILTTSSAGDEHALTEYEVK